MGLTTNVSTSSLIGVAIACSGNVLISLALTVQKLAHQRQHEELQSHSSSGSSTPSNQSNPSRPYSRGSRHTAPDIDPYSSESEPEEQGEQPSPSPSPKPRKASNSAVPVVLLDVEADPGTANSTETLKAVPVIPVSGNQSSPSGTGSGDGGGGAGRSNIGVPDSDRRRVRSRSPSPSPLRIQQYANSNLTVVNPNQTPIISHIHRSHHHKKAHDGSDDGEDDEGGGGKAEVEEGMYLKSKLWWLGMVLIAIGEGGNFLSYGFAPASVVAPLGTVALIANCVFAPLILREKFHLKELVGMGLAILGAVTVVYSSNASNPRLDPDGLVNAIKQIPFIVYTSINIALMILFTILSRSQRFGDKYVFIDVGVCALFGGYTVLSTKALSSLLSTMFLLAFKWWITWILVLVLIATSVLQVKFLNRALMRFQSKEVIPTQFVFFSLAAIIGSAVLYQEFRDTPFSSFVNFAFGIATTFLGVHLLTSFHEDDEDSNDDTSNANSRTSNNDRNEPPRPLYPSAPNTSASLNVLLPTTSRMSSQSHSFSERTPLLVPVVSPETQAQALVMGTSPPEGSSASRSTSPHYGSNLGLGPGGGRMRLVKKTSNSDFTPTLGLNSQAGFLLMATTPPSVPSSLGRRPTYDGRLRRDESMERRPSGSGYGIGNGNGNGNGGQAR